MERSGCPSQPGEDGHEAVRVLLVGCGPALEAQLTQRLSAPRWRVRSAAGGAAALNLLEAEPSDLLLMADSLPDLDPAEFQALVRARFAAMQIFSVDTFLAPPASRVERPGLRSAELSVAAVSSGLVMGRPGSLPVRRGETSLSTRWHGMVGDAPEMQKLFRMAGLVARRDTTVLIGGENGTGKDLLARAIHEASSRARQPFVVINCAAIPETLLESELFGYTKGAFTGASQSRTGRVHAAHGGTLFLDEIGEMPLPLQSKILRFLEQGEVQRIGGTETLKVDCRIVAATNVNLQQQVQARQFREDLYYRLAVMPLTVPPLRERLEDLPALCEGFLERFCPGAELHGEALERLLQHRWPGNIRELRNVMERASLFAEGRLTVFAEDIVF